MDRAGNEDVVALEVMNREQQEKLEYLEAKLRDSREQFAQQAADAELARQIKSKGGLPDGVEVEEVVGLRERVGELEAERQAVARALKLEAGPTVRGKDRHRQLRVFSSEKFGYARSSSLTNITLCHYKR